MYWDFMTWDFMTWDFHGLYRTIHECSHVTRVDISETTQDLKRSHDGGTSQDMSEYVWNTLTSDGNPRYLWREEREGGRPSWMGSGNNATVGHYRSHITDNHFYHCRPDGKDEE